MSSINLNIRLNKVEKLMTIFVIAMLILSVLTVAAGSLAEVGSGITSDNDTELMASGDFAGGDGTESDPYQISNWTELNETRDHLGANFTLTGDLDEGTTGYSEVASGSANGGKGFDPIGNSSTSFTGSFDGNGYTISNMTIDRSSEDYVGLFGSTDSDADIIDVGLRDVDIIGSSDVGSLVGNNSGTVTHSYITGSVDGSGGEVGGLVGNNYGTVSHSYSTADVNGTVHIGGLVGQSLGGTVEDSYATGDVTGLNNTGGLIGLADDQSEVIRTYYAKGLVALGEAAETNATSGGLIGSGDPYVENSYWDQWSSSQNSSAGGEWLTTEEMRENSSYNDSWNFGYSNTWNRDDDYNGGYPYLTHSTLYTVNANIEPEGKGWVEWTGKYPYGSKAELVFYPDVGYGIKDVTGCSGSFLGNVYTIDSVTQDCTINATLSILQTTTNVSCDPASFGEDYEECTDLEDIVADYWISAEEIDRGGDVAFIRYRYEGDASVSFNGTANATAWLGGSTSGTLNESNHTDITDTELNLNRSAQIVLTNASGNFTIFESGPHVLNTTGSMSYVGEGTFYALIGDKVHVEIGSLATCYVESPYVANVYSNASFNMTINPGYTLDYSAQIGGSIEGNSPQYIRLGLDGTQVEAVPHTGYEFLGWSDGLTDYTRQETDVNSTLDVTARFNGDFPGGNGSAQNPYQIFNATHLDNVRNMADGEHFVIQNDIDVSKLSSWTPIGTDSPFIGTIHGLNNVSMTINGLNGKPLFDQIGPGSDISDITISGSVQTGATGPAGLFANVVNGTVYNDVILNNITVDDTCAISGDEDIGGLAGEIENTLLMNTTIGADVNALGDNAGGVAGTINGTVVKDSYATGNVTGDSNVGGLIGLSISNTVTNSYAISRTTGNTNVGGLIGNNTDSDVSNCYAAGDVDGNDNVGGLIGVNRQGSDVSFSYWDIDAAGQDSSAGDATGLPTGAFAGQSAVENLLLNFDEAYEVLTIPDDGKASYPFLKNNTQEPKPVISVSELTESIDVKPAHSTITAGNSQSYTVIAEDEHGYTWDVTSIVDLSDQYDRGSSWNGNTITVTRAGTDTITADYLGHEDTAELHIEPGRVTSIFISPLRDKTITTGETIDFDARAGDRFGNLVFAADTRFTWENTSDEGVFDKTEIGTYNVTAIYGDVESATIEVKVISSKAETVEISPSKNQTIIAGETINFDAKAYDKHGNLIEDDDQEFRWNNTDENGLFDKTTVGVYKVVAVFNETHSKVVKITVEHGEMTKLDISPDELVTPAGEGVEYTAEAQDEYGNSWYVTDEANWSDDVGERSTWINNTLVVEKIGNWTITGRYDGFTDTAELRVKHGPAYKLSIEPGYSNITAGESQTYTGTAEDEYGHEWSVSSEVNWSDDIDGGSVWEDNSITVNRSGSWTITAKYENLTSKATLNVSPAEATGIKITPAESEIDAGEEQTYKSKAEDRFGNEWTITDETSWSDDVGGSSSWEENTITVTKSGTWNIKGDFNGLSDTVSLEVGPADAESITLTPRSKTITAGKSQAYSVTAEDQYGNTWNATSQSQWSDDVGVNSSWTGNEITVTEVGGWTITAEYEGLSDTASLTVNHGAARSLNIEPEDKTITAGESQAYQAEAVDEYGNSWDVTSDTEWSDDIGEGSTWNENVITVTESGTWSITGEYAGSSGSTDLIVDHADALSLNIDPDESDITAGESQTYSAVAEDEYGNTWDVTDETSWSDDVGEGSSWSGSTITVTEAGEWTVTGGYNGFSDTANLDVEYGEAESIDIKPAESTIIAGESQEYNAAAKDGYGNTWDVTDEMTWSDDVGEGSSWSGSKIIVTKSGEWTIMGEYDGISDTATLNVETAKLALVEINPSEEQTIDAGDDLDFDAEAFDEFDNLITDEDDDFEWKNADETGVFDKTEAGQYGVSATYEGVNSTDVTVTVEPAEVSTVEIEPSEDQTINVNDTIDFSAEAVDEYSNLITADDKDFTWENTDETGVFDKAEGGEYEVTATFEGVTSDVVTVTVKEGPEFSIEEITTDPEEPVENEETEFKIDITNNGDEAGTCTVKLLVDGEQVGLDSMEIDAGKTGTASITYELEGAGEQDVTLTVEDAQGDKDERQETIDVKEEETAGNTLMIILIILLIVISLIAVYIYREKKQ